MAALKSADSWKKLDDTQRVDILTGVGLTKTTKGAVGNEDEVLASLNRLSLEAWATQTAALRPQFAEARKQADKLQEPKTQHLKVGSGTLRHLR